MPGAEVALTAQLTDAPNAFTWRTDTIACSSWFRPAGQYYQPIIDLVESQITLAEAARLRRDHR